MAEYQVSLRAQKPSAPGELALGALPEPLAPLQRLLTPEAGAGKVIRRGRLLRLELPGVSVSLKALARMLKELPQGRSVEGSFRTDGTTGSLAYDGRLTKGRLKAPASNGLRLVWTDPPPNLAELHSGSPEPPSPPPSPPRAAKDLAGFAAPPDGMELLESLAVKGIQARLFTASDPAPKPGSSPAARPVGLELWSEGHDVVLTDWPGGGPRLALLGSGSVLLRLYRTKPWSDRALTRLTPLFQRFALRAEQWAETAPGNAPQAAPSEAALSLGPALLASPKLRSRYGTLDGQLVKLEGLSALIEALSSAQGRLPLGRALALLGGDRKRSQLYLGQLAELFEGEGSPCLSRSLDGESLLLHREALVARFELSRYRPEDPRRVTASGLDGRERRFESPIELAEKESLILGALLRYGTLSERELGRLLGTRRIAGLMDRLIGRLSEAGCHALKEAGVGDDGRLYRFEGSEGGEGG